MATPQALSERAARPPSSAPPAPRVAAVLMPGLLAGEVTAILQTYPGSPWGSLANAASPWLVVMFAAGALGLRPAVAALAILFAAVGVAMFALAGLHRRQHAAAARWPVSALPAGRLLELVCGQAF